MSDVKNDYVCECDEFVVRCGDACGEEAECVFHAVVMLVVNFGV